MRQRLFVSFLVVFFFYGSVNAQVFDAPLEKLATGYSQEKLYLHFDKPVYAPGETIWFKAYVLDGNTPAFESKTLYADWSDDKGKVIFRSVLPLVAGMSNGQMDLPPDYAANFIHVKVYTRWMLNFDTDFLYNKDIRIIQPAAITKKAIAVPEYSMQFFPEGGNFTAGVNNRIIFKVTDQWGRPAAVKGVVKNNKGQLQDSLRVIHDGMGNLFIQPSAGETFTAEWKDEKGKIHTTALPAVLPTGISVQVGISGSRRFLSLSSSPGGPDLVNLVGTMNQYKVFTVSKNLANGTAQAVIPTDQLPSGILTITAFDKDWKPLAERITFINNNEYEFQPQMEVEHWGLNKRARNEISITIPDSIVANLSVSVTDADIETDSSTNIISRLLLTGDLKGYVNDPAFYFMENSPAKMQMLDLVMLTNGWRRIGWQDLALGKLPAILYPKDTSYMSISGTVSGVIQSQLRDAGEIYLIIKQKEGNPEVVSVPVDKEGKFNDPALILLDTAQVYYQFSKKREMGNASVQFMNNFVPALSSTAKAAGWISMLPEDTTGFAWHDKLAAETRKRKFNELQTLAAVTVTAKKKTPLEEMDDKYTSGLFKFGDSYQFDLVNDPLASSQQSIFNYLQGRVAGLQITGTGGQTSLQWRGATPLLYVDEMQSDISMLSSLPVTDIAYVKVFRPPFMGGIGGGSGGAIAVYTRKGGEGGSAAGTGLPSSKITGYTISREFYSPNYDSFVKENELADNRTTLYWNPQVILSPQKKKVTLKFYNNDVSRAFRVIIEGMTSDGRLAHVEQIME